ncbi:MAG: caspase family protein [Ferruginibacter sp.]
MKTTFPAILCCCCMSAMISSAQKITEYPKWIVNDHPATPAVTLYAKATQRLVHIRNNKCWYFSLEGKQAGPAITVRTDKGDLIHPRISPSGKSIGFYEEADMLFSEGNLMVYNADSNNILGAAKVPGGAQLNKIIFRGDSVVQYYSNLKGIDILQRWSLATGRINRVSVFEDSASIDGLYDATALNDDHFLCIRRGDTLALASYNPVTDKDSILHNILLRTPLSRIGAVFSQGLPYCMITDYDRNSTEIYFFEQVHTNKVAAYTGAFEVLSADGNKEHCIALLKDSSGKLFTADSRRPSLQPFENKEINKQHIIETDAAANLILFSDPVSGSITAFDITSHQQRWQQTPVPAEIANAASDSSLLQQANDAGLFKVLIKQGTNGIEDWKYDPQEDKLYLLKNHSQFITLNPESKCAIGTETFNTEPYRTTQTTILPGCRYIYFVQEKWEKEEGFKRESYTGEMETFEDADKKRKLYPYKVSVYDRQLHCVSFEYQCTEEPAVNIVNDSLLSWNNYSPEDERITVHLYNLNTQQQASFHPFADKYLYDLQLYYGKNRKLYILGRESSDALILLNQDGRLLHTLASGIENAKMPHASFVPGGPFLYYNFSYGGKDNKVYKIENERVKAVYSFPANAAMLNSRATEDRCWITYSISKTVRNRNLIYTYLTEAVSGKTMLMDSTGNEAYHTPDTEIFPEKNLIVTRKADAFGWIDMQANYEYRTFGGSDPSIISLSYSPDGRYLAAANPAGKVMLWDLGTGKETRVLQVANDGYITKLAFSGDGKYLAASSGDIWETASGKNIVSVTDGRIWAVNSIDFSKDGKRIISGGTCVISWDAADGSKLYFQQYPRQQDMDTTGFCFKPQGCVSSDYPLTVKSTAFHPDSKTFVTGNVSGFVVKWNTENDSMYSYRPLYAGYNLVDKSVTSLQYTRKGDAIIAVQKNCIYKLNPETLDVLDSMLLPEKEEIRHIDMGYDDASFGCIVSRNNNAVVQVRNLKDLGIIKEFVAEGAGFDKLSFSPNGKQLATSSADGFCSIWDLGSAQPVMYLNNIGEYGNVMVTPDNYYMSSRSALDGVSFLKNGRYYSFDQFDLYLNRPDIILKRLGYASPELIHFYYNAYLKRLKRNGRNDSLMNDNIPVIRLNNRSSIAPVTRKEWQQLEFTITDSLEQMGYLTIFINGNPVLKKNLTGRGEQQLVSDSVQLNNAVNNIEVLYTNARGISGQKEKITVNYSPLKPIAPKIWFIGIGISDYSNPKLHLKYPVKDIKDLAAAIKKKNPGAVIDTLLNQQATRERIIEFRARLMKTGINDKVIVSFNGHGMLSDSLDWYFATYDIDAAQPEKKGLSYSMMESILEGIPARQKLLLIDACHSGEVDKETDITFANKETAMEQNVTETGTVSRGNIVISKSKAGLQTSFEMMQELFANLNNSSGTTVLSAAGGREYALESDEWKNGVFTYSILNALKDIKSTDTNDDKKISVKELKQSVFEAVKKLTGGRQKPTSRLEVLDDWVIW